MLIIILIIMAHTGILAGVWPCGMVTLLRELFIKSSGVWTPTSIFADRTSDCITFEWVINNAVFIPMYTFEWLLLFLLNNAEYICYDDGCHLRKYAANPCRRDLTLTTKALTEIAITVDKMHMAGHVDPWCRKTCDPKLFPDLNSVSSSEVS